MNSAQLQSSRVMEVSLYRRKGTLPWEHLPFIVMYAVTAKMMVDTFGEPYQRALELAARTEPEEEGGFLPPCRPLPGEYMPSFSSRLILGALMCLHVLLLLAQHWSVSVLCWIKYNKVAALKDATHAKIIPAQHQGKTELVDILRNEKGVPYLKFQKQNFQYEKGCTENYGFKQVLCPDSERLHTYLSPGLSGSSVAARLKRFGLNQFEIEFPSFQELYVEGLLKPFSVFQFFCVLLWCLDEYWQYSLLTLGMMLMFEGTVVMSRQKNLQTLRGMNNEPRQLLVRRDGVWTRVSANNLVPGDIISVTRGSGRDQDIVPCDCLIVKGTAVVNEAPLTGESVPQMKEAVVVDDDTSNHNLDVNLTHKVHILWGGTTILQHHGIVGETDRVLDAETSTEDRQRLRELDPDTVPQATPDGGCLCYVIRTGFDSSQGRLVRMIQFSSENVSGDIKETLMLMCILLVFAISASGYVLKHGLDEGRDSFDLLLHCILIVTSVIPPELNMQMALAVNTSLMALVKLHVFCTEPFRIPIAGKVDACLFDKTGTITSDELIATGVVATTKHCTCEPHYGHSHSSSSSAIAPSPMSTMPLEPALVIAGCHSLVDIDGETTGDPLEKESLKSIGWQFNAITNTSTPKEKTKLPWDASIRPAVKILHRYHFASRLQRMSVIADVSLSGKTARWVLVKGSAEKIGTLLAPSSRPSWYDATHKALAKQGMRVIALASRACPELEKANLEDVTRAVVETDLQFNGFVAFRCPVRKDSAAILQGLKESSHSLTMVTGDAVLTAIHVAIETGITKTHNELALLAEDSNGTLVWRNVETEEIIEQHTPAIMPKLAQKFDLCVTGDMLEKAQDQDETFWAHSDCVRVFARMPPARKEKLMMSLKDTGHHTLMCGDGANDVGALKQAHVGIALLSGFGSANVKKEEQPKTEEEKKAERAAKLKNVIDPNVPGMQDWSELTPGEQRQKQAEAIQTEMQALVAEGRNSFSAMFVASKNIAARQQKIRMHKMGLGGAGANGALANHAALLAAQDMDDGSVPLVKLGDASIAAPFTSKSPSIKACMDVIRQGRCTLVTTLQMYQILALNCLISSYSLSALYLDGVKSGDRQMTARGLLMTVAFLSVGRASPLDKLSSVRPLPGIFHPALIFSLLGQFVIHVGCMMYVVNIAKPHLPVDWAPNIDHKFEPNLINSVVFLMQSVQQVVVFAINYKGEPFMTAITKNTFLMYSLAFCGIGALVAATNSMPILNKGLQLVEYPSDGFGQHFMFVLVFNILGTFLWDRLMLAIFARDVLMASLKSITVQDVRQILKMVAIVLGVLWFFSVDPELYEEMANAAEQQNAEP
eukprot:m.20377 g.20377  ORF g.20377 m.20377 type:complete len:1339 (+) comp8156_c0_seq2:3-4019(+)